MILDAVAGIIIVLGFYFGYQRGLIKTVFDTISLIIGIVAALKLSPIVINFLEGIFKSSPALTFIIGIILTFVAVMFLIRFIGNKIEDVLKAVNINFFNKLIGGMFQALFFAIILSLAVGLVNKVKLISDETKSESITYPYLAQIPALSQKAFNSLKPVFSGFWDKTMETMEKVKSKNE